MALYVLEAPAGTAETACLYLGHMKAGRGFQTRGLLATSSGEPLWLAAPHPVFNLRLDDVGPNSTFESVQMTGWRFLAVSNGKAVATLELAAASRTDTSRFSRITDGRMAASAARVISKAERTAIVRHRQYALGMVRVPEIHVHALWLRDGDGGSLHDLFAAVIPAPAGVPQEKLLTTTRFMQVLANVKRDVIARREKMEYL